MHFFIQIFFLLIYTFHITLVSSLQCISYNDNITHLAIEGGSSVPLDEPTANSSFNIADCHADSNGCFVFWVDHKNGSISIKQKGCFVISGGDCDSSGKCIEKGPDRRGYLFCCCTSDLCNANFSWEPTPTVPSTTVATPIPNESNISFYLVYIVFPVSMVLLLLIMYLLKRRKLHYFNQVPSIDQRPQSSPPTPRNEKLRLIKLEEIVARGKCGTVWRATDKNEIVAVKVMPKEEKQSWLTEQEIFQLPFMNHDNILRLIAAEKRGDSLRPEFWLIAAYHPLGSMHDFLKSNIITWEQFCHICYTMARGLAHLHEEISSGKRDGYKPAIAHRDFKSSNVLLKNDLSVCIADFGLALILKPQQTCGDAHGQVGTRRYMAPEVLEGAINFSRDSFLRIDMYAFGLVLWELASRCSSFHQGPVPDYKLPFEAEVGPHPSLEDMQEVVVQQKRRPVIKKSWYQHPDFASSCCSIEECWDHDSEARVSACCIMERFGEYVKSPDSPNTPLLYNNDVTNAINEIYTEIIDPYVAV